MKRIAPERLDAFRGLQALAYAVVQEVAGGLRAGDTEGEAARRVDEALTRRGVVQRFHQPFAWFGERTALRFRAGAEFFPSRRRLAPGDVFILDVAPAHGSVVVDVGYTAAVGSHDGLERARGDLLAVRRDLLARVRGGASRAVLAGAVEAHLRDRGWDCAHARYPLGVLGHRVDHHRPPLTRSPMIAGFRSASLAALLAGEAAARVVGRPSPFVRHGTRDDAPLQPGLWAFEPHLGCAEFGAKFEEILVIDDDGVRWLDDTPAW